MMHKLHPLDQFERDFGPIDPSKYDELEKRASLHDRQKPANRIRKLTKYGLGVAAVSFAIVGGDKILDSEEFCNGAQVVKVDAYARDPGAEGNTTLQGIAINEVEGGADNPTAVAEKIKEMNGLSSPLIRAGALLKVPEEC